MRLSVIEKTVGTGQLFRYLVGLDQYNTEISTEPRIYNILPKASSMSRASLMPLLQLNYALPHQVHGCMTIERL